jgi:hypothetical protein
MRGTVLLVAALLMGCTSTVPTRCPWAPQSGAPCPTCFVREELAAAGEMVEVPSLRRPPGPLVEQWSGGSLPDEPPSPTQYVRCRPCDCKAGEGLRPWEGWSGFNRRAYARLRTARAPYPVAIVPGYHAGFMVHRYRIGVALQLLKRGWVAALILSGGHRRGGFNESRRMLGIVREMGHAQGIDVEDRVFVEPCAARTSTNLRNSLRMMAAFGLPRGLFVTEAKVTGQASVFSSDLDGLVARDLQCAVGRVSHVFGMTSLLRSPGSRQGCRAPLNFRHNYLTFALPRRGPVLFWVSPTTRLRGAERTTLDCGPGGPALQQWEPDTQDPWTSPCLPPLEAAACPG